MDPLRDYFLKHLNLARAITEVRDGNVIVSTEDGTAEIAAHIAEKLVKQWLDGHAYTDVLELTFTTPEGVVTNYQAQHVTVH